jgi:hypothetical protein
MNPVVYRAPEVGNGLCLVTIPFAHGRRILAILVYASSIA